MVSGVSDIIQCVANFKWSWVEQIARQEINMWPHKIIYWIPGETKRIVGRPQKDGWMTLKQWLKKDGFSQPSRETNGRNYERPILSSGQLQAEKKKKKKNKKKRLIQ